MERSRLSGITILAAASLVFAVALWLRIPSCYQSFWLDELHSAWTVWDDLGSVFSRAEAGHQSPFYFFALWGWKQASGGSELALRLSSVLATACACVVLTIGTARWSKSLIAGITSGLILAIESNAIFFGTELRPYALAIFFSSIVQVCFLELMRTASRLERPRLWTTLIGTILMAAMVQPTTIGVLFFFPVALMLRWGLRNRRETFRLTRIDALLLALTIAVLLLLWNMILGSSWNQRTLWSSFGSATQFSQLVQIWNWYWLLVLPLVMLAIAKLIPTITKLVGHGFDIDPPHAGYFSSLLILSSIAVAASTLYWLAAWLQWAPIWHRRYFVTVIPVFATIIGGAVGALQHSTGRNKASPIIAACAALLLITGLGIKQRTLQRLPQYPVALAVRGEGWREAVAWINQNAGSKDRVGLDPKLIESEALFSEKGDRPDGPDEATLGRDNTTQSQLDYLLFAVRGPYQLERPTELLHFENQWLKNSPATPVDSNEIAKNRHNSREFMLVRRSIAGLKTQLSDASRIKPFGGVSVIVAQKPK